MISRDLGYPVDRPTAVWGRYGGRCPEAKRAIWCLHAPIGRIKHGMALIIALPRTARIHWGTNGWQNVADGETQDTGLGLHGFELGAAAVSRARCIDFTFQWRDTPRSTSRSIEPILSSSRPVCRDCFARQHARFNAPLTRSDLIKFGS